VDLKRRLFDAVEAACSEGYCHFLCGMAQGCDLYACECVLELKKRYPEITLEAAIPCPSQANAWPETERTRYQRLLEQCDYETMVSAAYSPSCMQRRDRYMVDHAALLIAMFDGTSGGTRYTIEYAMRCGLDVMNLPIVEEAE